MKINWFHIFLLTLLVWSQNDRAINAQNNLVNNPGFEDVLDCDLQFGEAEKAVPWLNIDQTNVRTPDLFHGCAINSFFNLPAGSCEPIYPKTGDGMMGMVNLIPQAEEGIYTRLKGDIPFNTDIYVACSFIPSEKCGSPMELLCYSNTPCLVFSDIQFQSQQKVLESDTIIYETKDWTTLTTCYQATGQEKYLLIGNYKTAIEEMSDCDYIDEFNFAYIYIDDVIVSPFDVVPDTLFLCGDESVNLDASFYDVPISWSDGLMGGIRKIEEAGYYTVMGEVENCFMTDNMIVIDIPDETETINLTICKGGEIQLDAGVQSIWGNGKISTSRTVKNSGSYIADMQTSCGPRFKQFDVEEESCELDYYVPNAFSPNGDGINDEMQFFFNSAFEFSGELSIFDRWGNLLYINKLVSNNNLPEWDGRFKGEMMNPAVFVWTFKYSVLKDGTEKVEAGDFVLLR